MNVKINKYFLVLLVIILILGILNLSIGNSKNKNNMYLNTVEDFYKDYLSINDLLNVETDNYYKKNYLSKYSVKEIKDKYINMKINSQRIINEVNSLAHNIEGLNEKYIVDIAEDIVNTLSNDFLTNAVFDSSDEIIIKKFHKINSDLKMIFNKYKMLKIAF